MVKEVSNVSQLTAYERRRLNKSRVCTVCGEDICDYQNILMIKLRDRRNVYYNFYHKSCALNSGLKFEEMEHGEEK